MVLAHRTARAAAILTRSSQLHRLHPSSSPSSSFATPAQGTPAPPTRRSFHLGALGDAVVLTADGISFVHHAGLPWFLTIPLVALGVNVSLRLPIQYYTRRLVIRRNALTPLVKAWGARHAATVPVPHHNNGSSSSSNGDDGKNHNTSESSSARAKRLWQLRVAGLTERSRRRIYKAWRVQRWKSLAPLLSMAPFVVVTEALRRLCGAPLGWLGRSVGLGGGGPAEGAHAGAPPLLLDPCLADGGCLWFPDLTAMDPTYALPLLCAALLARSSWGRLSRDQLSALLTLGPAARGGGGGGRGGAQSPMARVRTAAGRTLLLVPLLPVLFADLPSAIFLYWATAFALTEVNEAVLARVLPSAAPGLTSTPRRRLALPYLRGTHVRSSRPGEETG
ncbi:Mitochondrial inner membrane protein COX18 [Escovopsis weberi]|uniref:Mitochondrial inner membrane protein COX18 n=1 Tax=Escovopsis weberi TaxID=150374 RepID=A0A0M8N7W8_ESCWE|nr:Mitochondrial inner membrane protein COX18 [Escovopsis weberi]